ncbi:TPA: hypothetical protein U1W51_000867 [Streptococcus suis]|nr:hypothetical protein [Streptococcus suis]HEM4137303.1 hypothetical protein [Streptococcus suis]
MGIFSLFKKPTPTSKPSIQKAVPQPPMKKPYRVNGRYYPNFSYDDVYEWANDPVPGTEILISDLIFLWVVDRLGGDVKKYPIHLSRNYGVDRPDLRITKLIKVSLATANYTVTELGKDTIAQNRHIIELHKKGWVSDEDSKQNLENDRLWQNEYAEYLKKIGDTDGAKELRQRMSVDDKAKELNNIFNAGEKLSKEKKYQESNSLLLPLSENDEFLGSALLFERIAINYRGLREYEKEIEICERFLKDKQPLYGGVMWKDVFYKRIEFARKKLK